MGTGKESADKIASPQPSESSEVGEEQEDTSVNIAMKCAKTGDVARLSACFTNAEDPFHELVADYMNERDDEGKLPIDVAALLGKNEVVQELLTRGCEANVASEKQAYTPLHHAAVWGRVSCLKTLIDNGADLQARTSHGERAREIALRYDHTECVDYLDWAEARSILLQAIQTMKETVTDPEKVQGRLTRDDKNKTVALCNEKADWVEKTTDATTLDLVSQKQEFDEAVETIVQKLSEPPVEKPEKK